MMTRSGALDGMGYIVEVKDGPGLFDDLNSVHKFTMYVIHKFVLRTSLFDIFHPTPPYQQLIPLIVAGGLRKRRTLKQVGI